MEAVEHFPVPTSIRQLRKFIGLITYYLRFIPVHLSNLLERKKNQNITLQQDAFNTAKSVLANFTKLSHISNDENVRIFLTTYASNMAIGMVIEQEIDLVRNHISFFSAELTKTKTNYSTFYPENCCYLTNNLYTYPKVETL